MLYLSRGVAGCTMSTGPNQMGLATHVHGPQPCYACPRAPTKWVLLRMSTGPNQMGLATHVHGPQPNGSCYACPRAPTKWVLLRMSTGPNQMGLATHVHGPQPNGSCYVCVSELGVSLQENDKGTHLKSPMLIVSFGVKALNQLSSIL